MKILLAPATKTCPQRKTENFFSVPPCLRGESWFEQQEDCRP
jgi:hypothetical protein